MGAASGLWFPETQSVERKPACLAVAKSVQRLIQSL